MPLHSAQLFEAEQPPKSPRERVRRASAGQRRSAGGRVTSWHMSAEDELVLDRLRDHYGTEKIGEAVRRGLRAALAAEGIELHPSEEEDAVAA